MASRTTLFLFNRSQAVRLARSVAFAEVVREVVVTQDGPRRIISPADGAWDDFFEADGVNLGDRQQPAEQQRDQVWFDRAEGLRSEYWLPETV